MATGNVSAPAYDNPTRLVNIAGVSGVTIEENRTYRIGKLVVVNIRFTLSQEFGANSTVVQGFPPPASALSSGSSIVALSSTKTATPFSIIGSGELIPTLTAPAQLYVVSGCYIAAS